MNYLAVKYINLLSSQLRNFKKKDAALYNFSCPYCGDSHRHPRKARGYVFDQTNEAFYKCWKCGKAAHFEQFLKDQDASLFKDYIREKFFKTKAPELEESVTVPSFKLTFNPLAGMISIAESGMNGFKNYVINRKIPEDKWSALFICPEFKKFTNSLIPGKFNDKSLSYEEGRLLMPFLFEGEMFGYSGRSLAADTFLRYINITLDENIPKLFGMDRWDRSKKTFVTEGPIDSLFLNNCLASCGGDIVSAIKTFDKSNFVIVYDNEPRSSTTKVKLLKAIDAGYKVVIWPSNIDQKDINDMILKGFTQEEVEEIIDEYTFEGFKAKLALGRWTKK